MNTLSNVKTHGGQPDLHNARLGIIPEAVSSKTGVSVGYVHAPDKKWYVLRATYGRADQAADFLINDGNYVYIAKRYTRKTVNGKQKKVLESLIPNLLFAYITPEKSEQLVKHTPALTYLTYYYDHFKKNADDKNPPLTVPSREMENFIYATCSQSEHLLLVNKSQVHYRGGEMVRVTDGLFKGVEGRVARVAGQQRVIVSLSRIGLVSTAYIPTAFLTVISE